MADLILLLENGKYFYGKSFGFKKDIFNFEIVFQTGMVGYVESLTDPSYRDQMLVLTYPLVGNYGVPSLNVSDEYGIEKYVESSKIHPTALIVGEYIDEPSHYQSTMTLSKWLYKEKVVGITGIDTRELTKIIREYGTMGASIFRKNTQDFKNMVPKINPVPIYEGSVRTFEKIRTEDAKILNILAIDCGMKNNQIRRLLNASESSVRIKVVPHHYDFLNSDFEYDRIFLSNGPGNPEDFVVLVERLRTFMKKNETIPIFGICMGHQVVSLASGGKITKLKYGNRGHNIPCKLTNSNKCYITTQNHGYALDNTNLSEQWKTDWEELFVNENDGTNEGIIHKTKPYFTSQFHPEAKAGPEDTDFLFDIFLRNSIEELKAMRTVSQIERKNYKKVLVLGSGGLQIGQSGEFDYSGSQAIKAFKEEGLDTVLINPNIATCQTSPGFVDKVYFLPVTFEYVKQVIEIERPDCLALSFGGQTALNCGVEIYKSGLLEEYNIDILGTPVDSIIATEDRDVFKNRMANVGERVPEGIITDSLEEAIAYANKIGYPVLVRAAYALGGLGSGFANNSQELLKLLNMAFANSSQVTIDKSLRGWKEVEYEIVRDRFDNCISVCNMENLDPLGIHTGESIVVAPSQTLTDAEYQMLRSVALKAVRSLGIVGECNIQYALDPHSNEYKIIEINARLSRSSALASKATGYPLAYVAAKLGLGYSLYDLKNSITKTTSACFEPSLDYCVVKIPRWDLQKFDKVSKHIDSAMKSIGESMAISRSFEEAFQKAFRNANPSIVGFEPNLIECTDEELSNPTYQRILAVATGLYNKKYSVDEIHNLSKIDKWFLYKLENIMSMKRYLEKNLTLIDNDVLRRAKQLGFSDIQIAKCIKSTEFAVKGRRKDANIHPFVKRIDTVSAEFPCDTNYLYSTYNAEFHDISLQNPNTVMVLGSGVYKIGSSVEFDWCAVSCIRELKELGKTPIVINCNPETVSTDYDEADRLYFDELSFETVMDVYEMENPEGVVISMGGQIPNNIAMKLYLQNVKVIGTSPEMIDNAENRFKFSRMLDKINVDQPMWRELTSVSEAKEFANNVKYPVLVRPSYVLSGAAMNVAFSDKDLEEYLKGAKEVSQDSPVVISKFISDAKEIEVDAVAENGWVKLIAISEHVENAGVHSGDATLILPAHDLTEQTIKKIKKSVYAISKSLKIHGPFNIQFIAKDDKVKVIECNLRVSRTFPFVSKTLGVNFVKIATQIMCGENVNLDSLPLLNRVGVKVPQFSFNRLKGADILLDVEMQSTGEVAAFGKDHHSAYLKGLIATGFVWPKESVLISIGSYKFKMEMLNCIRELTSIGYKLYGTHGTADFYKEHGIDIKELALFSTSEENKNTILNRLSNGQIDLVINISEKNKIRCSEQESTSGYQIRRLAVESKIPIVTDIKCAKLLVSALVRYQEYKYQGLVVDPSVDSLTSHRIVKLPGLVDVHVHVRDPGQTQKEDWETCSKAALFGGITTIGAMPNTDPAICDKKSFELVKKISDEKSYCDYMLYLGANSENYNEIHKLGDQSAGLKLYLNNTFGPLLLKDSLVWAKHIEKWTSKNPICAHAESKTLPAILHIANIYKKHIHICHVARKEEIELIRLSKLAGMNVTCEVAPHHLFMNEESLKAPLSNVKPPLVKDEDVKALWDNLDFIDCFATDHAPHLVLEKEECGCPGFPGLETALPLLLTAVKEGRLTIKQIVEKYHDNPIKIFNLPKQEDTYIEVDLDQEWTIPSKPRFSKCGWTPFAERKVYGMVKRVVLRGKLVYLDGNIVGEKGYGQNLRLVHAPQVHQKINVMMRMSTSQSLQDLISEEARITGFEGPYDTSLTASSLPKMRNIVSSKQFDREILRRLFDEALKMKEIVKTKGKTDILKGKVMASIFYEPSTRTRCSFAIAMKRLGGKVQEITSDRSSVQKGETLEDFVRCMECYSDVIVLRSDEKDCCERATRVLKKPFINAGNGVGEHPTQALLDTFTIREEIGTVNNITVTIVGDLKHGRTVHSLVQVLSLYDVRLRYVSPESLKMPREIYNELAKKGIEQTEHTSLDGLVETTDVIYVTRIQSERFKDQKEYEKVKGSLVITPQILSKGKPTLRVLHPLPRVDEIDPNIDSDDRTAYFRQMENGMYVRMAILKMLLA